MIGLSNDEMYRKYQDAAEKRLFGSAGMVSDHVPAKLIDGAE